MTQMSWRMSWNRAVALGARSKKKQKDNSARLPMAEGFLVRENTNRTQSCDGTSHPVIFPTCHSPCALARLCLHLL